MKKVIVVSLLFLLFFNSCALIFKGDSAAVAFNSNPSGAQVLIDGVLVGNTPARLVLKTNRSYTITFRLAGHKDQIYVLNNQIGALWIVLDIVTGFVPLVIDAATGAWYEFSSTNVSVTLTPNTLTTKPLPHWAKELIKAQP